MSGATCQLAIANDEACGVAAIGRCARCSKAFCLSHQARDVYKVLVDQCANCLHAEVASQQAARWDAGAVERWVSNEGADFLRKHGAETVEYFVQRTDYNRPPKRLFRPAPSPWRYELQGRGWLLGKHSWKIEYEKNMGGGKSGLYDELTLLREDGELYALFEWEGRLLVEPGWYCKLNHGWPRLARAISELAGAQLPIQLP